MDLRQLRQPRLNLASDFSTDPLLKFKVPATGKESNMAQITLIVEMGDTHTLTPASIITPGTTRTLSPIT